MPLTPGISPNTRLLRVNWLAAIRRGAGGVPAVPDSFVAESGPRVRVLDIRDDEHVTGPIGYIPGAWRLAVEDAPNVAAWSASDDLIVLVCTDGERSGVVARYLETLGMRFVAAMDGGMLAWKTLGYGSSHDGSLLERRFGPDTPAPGERLARAGNLTLDAVRGHLGDTGAIRWIRLAALLVHGKRSCVDGRDDHGVVGTPGGDAGEFVLSIAALERLSGQPVGADALSSLLQQWVDAFGRFYMHTDDHALDHLIGALRDDAVTGPVVSSIDHPNAWRTFLAAPPESVRERVLELLLDPNNVGCGHLKLMLLHPDLYGVRPTLVPEFLRAWFHLRWSGATDLEYVVLAGGHAEGAVLQVTVDDDLWALSPIPMVAPFSQDTQVFVNHPQVVDFLREQTAHFIVRAAPSLGLHMVDHGALVDTMRDLAGTQMGETLTRLANGLPVYRASFGSDGISVHSEGKVG